MMDFLCLDFINSYFETEPAFGNAPLMDDERLRLLCRKWNLAEPEKELRAALPQLRRDLDQAAREYAESGAISPNRLAALNARLDPVAFHHRIERHGAGFELRARAGQAESGLFAYRVVVSFAELVSNYEASRLKLCENPACGWVFYDESKSRTRRWCDNTCASLIKVRRFRKKQAEAGPVQSSLS